jgi:hypothetical protein
MHKIFIQTIHISNKICTFATTNYNKDMKDKVEEIWKKVQ